MFLVSSFHFCVLFQIETGSNLIEEAKEWVNEREKQGDLWRRGPTRQKLVESTLFPYLFNQTILCDGVEFMWKTDCICRKSWTWRHFVFFHPTFYLDPMKWYIFTLVDNSTKSKWELDVELMSVPCGEEATYRVNTFYLFNTIILCVFQFWQHLKLFVPLCESSGCEIAVEGKWFSALRMRQIGIWEWILTY